ncbi:MAG: hypothetical protein JRJ42_00880 [Deltaproteobacteria bacterium]|nr:hypothetical protein [Deltaproteobacteria bacterium]
MKEKICASGKILFGLLQFRCEAIIIQFLQAGFLVIAVGLLDETLIAHAFIGIWA